MAPSKTDALKAYQASLNKSRARLDRLMDRRSVLALQKFYTRAQDDLEARLMKMAKGVHKEPLTPLQVQQLLQQVRLALQIIAGRLHQQFMPISEEAQQEGLEQVAQTIEEQERRAFGLTVSLPLGDAAVDAALIEKRRRAFELMNAASYRRFGEAVAGAVEGALAGVLAIGGTPADAIEKIRETADENWWQSERIIHTELPHAFNTAHSDSIALVAQQFPGMGKRWCELVDDLTGRPLDNRVGNDSLVLHGQITDVKGRFVMPPDPSVHRSFWNQTYLESPNRPNDRSITMPWRPGWGVPGYLWKNGTRVPIP